MAAIHLKPYNVFVFGNIYKHAFNAGYDKPVARY